MRIPSELARSPAIKVAFAVLAVAYLLQLAGPLRIDTDSAWYLHIASSIADGNGAHPAGAPSFPVGYPLLVAGLDVVGLGTPWGLVALNLAFLALGLTSLWVVLRRGLDLDESASNAVCALTLLSSLLIRHTAMPLSEVVFFGLAATSVAVLTISSAGHRRSLLAGGIILALAACSVRTAGIALAPAVILALPSHRSRIVAAVAVVVPAAVTVAAVPRYLDELFAGWNDGVLGSGVDEAHDLLKIVGAAVGNVPQSKLGTVSPLLFAIGAAALVAVVAVLVARRHRLGPVDGWVIGSLLLLYVWPTDATRFMLPTFPFLLGYGALLARRWRSPAVAYVTLFAALGLVAMTLSTRLTFSGEQFPERYAGGVLAPTYRVAWGLARPGDRARISQPELEVLRRYDPDPPDAGLVPGGVAHHERLPCCAIPAWRAKLQAAPPLRHRFTVRSRAVPTDRVRRLTAESGPVARCRSGNGSSGATIRCGVSRAHPDRR